MTRAEKRRLRAQHLKKSVGRPEGKVPFAKTNTRFEVAIWHFLKGFSFDDCTAARLAAWSCCKKGLLELTQINAAFFFATAQEETGESKTARYMRTRADYVLKRVNDAYDEMADDKCVLNWIVASAGALTVLIIGIREGDLRKQEIIMDELARLGWAEIAKMWAKRIENALPNLNLADSPRSRQRLERRLEDIVASVNRLKSAA
jgi:hypothetical protein